MTRIHFQEELRNLEREVLSSLDVVEDMLGRTIEVIEHRDIELASEVIAQDDKVDRLYITLHHHLLGLMALQTPVASDLRLVAAIMHVCHHAERMGDQCVNVAKLVPLAGTEAPVDDRLLNIVLEMGRLARAEVWQAKRAFAERNVELAEDLPRQDEAINRLNRQTFQLALEIGDDPEVREWAMHMVQIARAMERIGDNAVDIGEQVVFVVTGQLREFTDASHPDWAPKP